MKAAPTAQLRQGSAPKRRNDPPQIPSFGHAKPLHFKFFPLALRTLGHAFIACKLRIKIIPPDEPHSSNGTNVMLFIKLP